MSNMNREPDTTMGALPHVLGLLFGFIGPLLVYVFSDEDFVRENAANALTWQVFFLIYTILAFVSSFLFIGFLILPLLIVLNLVFPIIGAIKASNGEIWSYPFTVDLINNSKSRQGNQGRNNQRQRRQTSNQTQDEQYGGVEYGSVQQDEEKTQEERISELKNRYMQGEISEDRFNKLLDEELSEDEDKDFSQQYN